VPLKSKAECLFEGRSIDEVESLPGWLNLGLREGRRLRRHHQPILRQAGNVRPWPGRNASAARWLP
jgi:hypothetical protein